MDTKEKILKAWILADRARRILDLERHEPDPEKEEARVARIAELTREGKALGVNILELVELDKETNYYRMKFKRPE